MNLIIIDGGSISKAKSYSGNLEFPVKTTGTLGSRRKRVVKWNLYAGKFCPAKWYNRSVWKHNVFLEGDGYI